MYQTTPPKAKTHSYTKNSGPVFRTFGANGIGKGRVRKFGGDGRKPQARVNTKFRGGRDD